MPISRKNLFDVVHSPTIRFIKQLTQQEYDQLPGEDPGTIYIITEEPNVGPVLLCPYVMDSQASALLGPPFDSFSYTDGVATGTTSTALEQQQAGALADYERQTAGVPSGESLWWSIAPGNGKIAFEAEVSAITGDFNSFQVVLATGNFADGDYALLQSAASSINQTVSVQGAGPRLLVTGQSSTLSRNIQVGDRVGIVVDTDSGSVDMVGEAFHENFGGVPMVDMSDGMGVSLQQAVDSGGEATSKLYTKAADMQLPYPAGTTDSCLTGGLRELVAYPLDASEAELQTVGVTGRLSNPSLAQQRGERTIPDGSPTGIYYMAKIEGGVPDTLDVSVGAVAFETEFFVPDFSPEAAGSLEIYTLVSGSADLQLDVNVDQDGTKTLQINNGDDEVLSGETFRVGVLIDNDGGAVRAWLNGSELTVTTGFLGDPSAYPLLIGLIYRGADDNGAAGTTPSVRLITDPYWFTTPFPAGSRDINGNVFN